MTDYATAAEQISKSFLAWEVRGRGWQLADTPCELEPPFRPFFILPGAHGSGRIDDGRRSTLFSSVASLVAAPFTKSSHASNGKPEAFIEPTPHPHASATAPRTTLSIRVPSDFKSVAATTKQLLLALGTSVEPVSFEIIGQAGNVTLQLTIHSEDERHVVGLIQSFCPQIVVGRSTDLLAEHWMKSDHRMVIDFGLSEEFFLPLESDLGRDSFLPLIPSLASAELHEVLAVQVMFQRTRNRWERSVLDAVGESESDCIYADATHFVRLAKEKTAAPLFAVSLRLGIASQNRERLRTLGRGVMPFIKSLDRAGSNQLVPLENHDYSDSDHDTAFIGRYSFRTGMLLSLDELALLAHFPDASVSSEALQRDTKRTRALPGQAGAETILGISRHANENSFIRISMEERLAHTHVIGASGTGKSTLLRHLAMQDIEAGRGVAVLDPAGDLVDDIAKAIPASRIADVVYFDPSDLEYPIGLGLLEAGSEIEKISLADDITAIFERLSTSWGDTMTTVMANAIMAVLEHTHGGTLLGIRRMLIDDDFRKTFLAGVQDEEVRFFWQKQYPAIGSRSVGPILSRLDTFLRPKTIRNIVAVKRGPFSVSDALRGGKILLAKLSQGLIGEQNSFLLGSLLIAKIQQAAIARQAVERDQRSPYFLYVDECHNFVTPSLNALLVGTRKYGLGVTLAHQHLSQLDSVPAFRKALLGNAHTRIAFRVGEEDARDFDRGFAHFEASDLLNLGRGEAIGRSGEAANDFSLRTVVLPASSDSQIRLDAARASSRDRYASRVVPPVSMAGNVERETPPPQPTVVETVPTASTVEVVQVSSPTTAPKRDDGRAVTYSTTEDDSGKGGREHKYIQHLIKRLGEDRGYRASVEHTVEGGRVDIVLSKDSATLAFEISVTNTASYELGNLEKCLKASFARVFFVCADAKRREKVKQLLEKSQPGKVVSFLAPEEVVAALDEIRPPETPAASVVRGYRVKVNRQSVSSAELAGKRAVIAEVIAKSMMR